MGERFLQQEPAINFRLRNGALKKRLQLRQERAGPGNVLGSGYGERKGVANHSHVRLNLPIAVEDKGVSLDGAGTVVSPILILGCHKFLPTLGNRLNSVFRSRGIDNTLRLQAHDKYLRDLRGDIIGQASGCG
jgi:hypothetical protein